MLKYSQWLKLRPALYSCYDGVVEGKRQYRMPVNFYSAWLLRKGSITVAFQDDSTTAYSGEWMIVPPGERLTELADEVQLLSVLFFADWVSGSPLLTEGLPTKLSANDFPELERSALELNCSFEERYPNHDYFVFNRQFELTEYLQVQSLLPKFLIELFKALSTLGIEASPEKAIDRRVSKAIEILSSSDPVHGGTIAELAEKVGLSLAQFERLFTREMNVTPKQYLDQRRISHAMTQLCNPSIQIKQIAAELGFISLGNFTRWFKRFSRYSPREFRSINLEDRIERR